MAKQLGNVGGDKLTVKTAGGEFSARSPNGTTPGGTASPARWRELAMKKATGICKLCGQQSELQNPHIIPEIFYDLIYDEIVNYSKVHAPIS